MQGSSFDDALWLSARVKRPETTQHRVPVLGGKYEGWGWGDTRSSQCHINQVCWPVPATSANERVRTSEVQGRPQLCESWRLAWAAGTLV